MLKFISAVMAAAAIAGILTLPTTTTSVLPRTQLLATDHPTRSAGMVCGSVSDPQSILFETSQIEVRCDAPSHTEGDAAVLIASNPPRQS
jgi:hypothetical protein